MELKTLSASSVERYENCPAWWKATYTGKRVQDIGNSAADLGNACHGALEQYGQALMQGALPTLKELLDWYDHYYFLYFTDRERYDEGYQMLCTWHARTDLSGRTILSTEAKEHFDLPTSAGTKWVTYIFDREDRLSNGEIEIVDYKTWSQPIKPEQIKRKIQGRIYAVAGAIRHPDAPAIWVTMDQLRFEPVGVRFTRDENVDTWNYLRRVAERIIADREAKETINPNCNWCIRKGACNELMKHVRIGGRLATQDKNAAADQRRELVDAKKALGARIDELDDFLLRCFERDDEVEFSTDTTECSVRASSKRVADPERVAAIIGPALATKYRNLNMSTIDRLLKGSELTPEQKREVKGCIRNEWNNPSIKTVPIPAHER
jgi:hypothetical protein